MPYDPTPDLLRLVQRLPATPYTVEATSYENGQRVLTSLYVRTDGTLEAIVRRDRTAQADRADLRYRISPTRLLIVDSLNGEWTERPVSGPLDQRLTASLGGVGLMLALVADRATAKATMLNGVRSGTWTKSGGWLTVRSPGAATTRLAPDAVGRLGRVEVRRTGYTATHQLRYRPGGFAAPITVPRGYVRRSQIQPRPPLPLGDNATEARLRGALRFHGRFVRGAVVTSDTRIWLDGARLGEDRFGVSWRYNGYVLTLRDRTGLYQGTVPRDEILARLAKRGRSVDPYTRSLLVRQNPVRTLLAGATRMRTVGAIGTGATAITLIELTGTGRKLILGLDAGNRLRQVDSAVQAGRVQRMTRKFRYENARPPGFELRAKPGERYRSF